MDDLLGAYAQLRDPAAQWFACNLLGDAGTDWQLEAVEAHIIENTAENPMMADTCCELCRALTLWGRLSAVHPILVAYDRFAPSEITQSIPSHLTKILESERGVAYYRPLEDKDELFIAYDLDVRRLWQRRLRELGGPKVYALNGGPFSVRRLAERLLELLGTGDFDLMMRPFLRQRFESSTGIDCSDFYKDGDSQPLTIAARIEAWLESPEASKYEPGERYFFGHRIPRAR